MILLLFSASFSLFPNNFIEGNALSSSIDSHLRKNGFSPVQQNLSQTGQDDFAYNILIDFPSETKENGRNSVIFCLKQEDYFQNEDTVIDFLTFLKNKNKSWSAEILFSALDEPAYSDSKSIKGTEVFASSVDDSDSCCAITLNFDSTQKTAIFTGSKKYTTPLWLTRRITDSFYETKIPLSFEDRLSSIYRLGIINGRERLSYFFANHIPAVELNLSDPHHFSALKKFCDTYTSEGTDEWDMHYIYFSNANLFKAFFINERVILISCLATGILTILLLCIFSFIGENGERHKYEFFKSSYMIAFTILISYISLVLGQHAVAFLSSAFSLNPIFQYGIKVIFSMLFISILFTVQGILKISVTAFMYGYLLLVVSICNIFIFTAMDLALFVIFVTEYILIYISRSAKTLPTLSVFFILMIIPFIPYGFIIIRSAEDIELTNAVFATTKGNLLLSLAIFPFQITWLRMLVFLNVHAGLKGYTMRKMIFNAVFSTIAILAFCFAAIFLISHFVYRPDLRMAQKYETKIVRDERFTLSTKLSKNTFSGMNTNHIKISSEESALRYEVKLRGTGKEPPVYDSIYSYTLDSDSEGEYYSFIIPDYPPQTITIDYASSSRSTAEIDITAFYRTDEPHVFRTERRTLKVEREEKVE